MPQINTVNNIPMKIYLTISLLLCPMSVMQAQEIPKLDDVETLTFIPDYVFTASDLSEWTPMGPGNWEAKNGEITGRLSGAGTPSILALKKSYQDLAFQFSVKKDSHVETGVLLRFQETGDGHEATFLSIGDNEVVPYHLVFDQNGKETSRKKLIRAGGIFYRIAPPMEETEERNTPNYSRPPLPSDIPVESINTDFKIGEWNQVELYLDINMLRAFLNDGNEIGATTGAEKNEDGFGPVALYIGGEGEVQFKNILLKDISIKETPLEVSAENFNVQRISDMYYSWGADAADFNQDGVLDVVAGPYIYFGPDFVKRKEVFPAIAVSPSLQFTSTNVQFTYDFNEDGWPDILTSPSAAVLFINPQENSRRWKQYKILPSVQSEITDFIDIDSDGKPELVYGADGHIRYAKPGEDPTQTWHEYNVSEKGYAMAHGIGTGDINGDGRVDILNPLGWWEQPEILDSSKTWAYHPVAFGRYGKRARGIGGSLMAVYDVNGNGKNDVVTVLNAHGFGLAWYEQTSAADGSIAFKRHMISDDYQAENAGGVTFSQAHGTSFADIDNDGIEDFIIGKRVFTHLDNYYDPDPYSAPVLYWYKTVRNPAAPGGAEFVPYLIHNRSGAGSEITVKDLDGNGNVDIVTSTNRGTFIYWNKFQK